MSDAVLSLPLTRARIPAAEEKAREALAALVSALRDAADGTPGAIALGGPHAAGEAATVRLPGEAEAAGPFELWFLLDVAPRRAAALAKTLRAALDRTARARKTAADLRVVAAAALGVLPPSPELTEFGAFGRVLDGPEELLAPARAAAARPVPKDEALRLLVRAGAGLLAAERALAAARVPAAAAAAALVAGRRADLALGAAVLLAAGRFVPGEEARDAALRELAGGEGGASGPHTRMSWTRFRDLVDRHRIALAGRGVLDPDAAADARKLAARAADRWMELVKLIEEERLGQALPDWTVYAQRLAARLEPPAAAPLFFGVAPAEPAGPTRRSAKKWPLAERLAPAVAALLDWDPGDLGVAPRLLDLPDDAARDVLAARAAALADELRPPGVF